MVIASSRGAADAKKTHDYSKNCGGEKALHRAEKRQIQLPAALICRKMAAAP